MASVFITGSADGLGQLAAKALVELGHHVVLHARNTERGKQATKQVTGAEAVLSGDLSSMDETKSLAFEANALGKFDAVIHNAGAYRVPMNSVTTDGLPLLFAVNSLAPYILTCLMYKPNRLIYLSSGMHFHGNGTLDNLPVNHQGGTSRVSYSDTKLHDVILTMAVARKWKNIYANAVDPGWVPTKMGGAGAPDSLEEGIQTQVWLAISNDPGASVSGCYFHHKKQDRYKPVAREVAVQEKFLALCEQITGVKFDGA